MIELPVSREPAIVNLRGYLSRNVICDFSQIRHQVAGTLLPISPSSIADRPRLHELQQGGRETFELCHLYQLLSTIEPKLPSGSICLCSTTAVRLRGCWNGMIMVTPPQHFLSYHSMHCPKETLFLQINLQNIITPWMPPSFLLLPTKLQ